MKRYLFIILLIIASMATIMQKDSWAIPVLDLNGDAFVDDGDVAEFYKIFTSYNSTPSIYDERSVQADYDVDGDIDFYDFGLFNLYLSDYKPSVQTQAVPEPATLALMGMGLLALSGMSLRKRKKNK